MAVKPETRAPQRPLVEWPGLLLRFGRLHTLVATTVQVTALAAVAAASGAAGPSWLGLALTWAACLAANVYVVGLNQLTDVAIDRVNKPDLPLASREMSRAAGRRIVLVAAVIALALALAQSLALTLTVLATLLVGTIYSLPPRLKNRPLLAAISIALVRGVVANVGLYLHFAGTSAVPGWFWVAVAFFFGFGLLIALFKDIPDHKGDRRFGVGTFAVRWGPRPAFALGRALLTALYLLPIGAALARGGAPGVALAVAQGALLAVFWAVSLRTEPERPRSMFRLYFVLWGLFYAEYGLLALYAWWG
jgi:homogentisate phytyltransferase/homogentisate geranylgeranyltransferase